MVKKTIPVDLYIIKKTSVSISEEMFNFTKSYAKKNNTTPSEVLRNILLQFLKQYYFKNDSDFFKKIMPEDTEKFERQFEIEFKHFSGVNSLSEFMEKELKKLQGRS